jgi:signal transduction histidine kinase
VVVVKTSAVTALLRLSSLAGGSWEEALQEILVVAADILGVRRFSYWRLREQPRSIVCELGFVGDGSFERGSVLREFDAVPYFNEIRKSQVVVVEDALQDPRTKCLSSYLEERRVASLLDAPVRVDGALVGIACAEHVGGLRKWTAQEQEQMVALSQIIASRLESKERLLAQRREQRTEHLADVNAALAETLDPARAAALAVQRALPSMGDMGVLVTQDDRGKWQGYTAHVKESDREVLEELLRRYPPGIGSRGLVGRIMRERQTLFMPRIDEQLTDSFGIEREEVALIESLGVRSAIGLPLIVRGQLIGAVVFGVCTRAYDQNDVEFAERYAARVGVILENLRLYRQSQAATRARDEFLSLASHELRTPITTLRLSAHALARKAAELKPNTFTILSDRILRQTARLDRLAERLLDSCQIDQNGISIEPIMADLGEVVREVAYSFLETARTLGTNIEVSGDTSLVAYFDPLRIEQVLSNLIDNALKFGEKKPVLIDLQKKGHVAVIVVKDGGIGIPEAERDHVFSPYRRGETAQGIGGLGLGLHVVRQIVQAHGGDVRLDSNLDSGTTVIVELPIEPPSDATTDRRPTSTVTTG